METVYVVFLICVMSAHSYPGYKEKIPNADKVKEPDSSVMFPGVGHFAANGSGERNCFGKDFKIYKLDWQKVCQLDSDGDGKTNGEELGDPSCSWTLKNSVASGGKNAVITHPGICTPTDSATCKHYNAKDSSCEALAPSKITTTPKTNNVSWNSRSMLSMSLHILLVLLAIY